MHRAVVHKPREQPARIASRIRRRLEHHIASLETEAQRRRDKRKVVTVRREFADYERTVVLQIGELRQLVDIRPRGVAARDNFNRCAERSDTRQHFIFAVRFARWFEAAAEAERNLQFERERRKHFSRQLRAVAIDITGWQRRALDRPGIRLRADLPAANPRSRRTQNLVLDGVGRVGVSRYQFRRHAAERQVACARIGEALAQGGNVGRGHRYVVTGQG